MGIGRLFPITILLAVGLTAFTLLFDWLRKTFVFEFPWLWWVLFGLAAFLVLYLTSYLSITRRVRRIQDMMEESGLSNAPVKRGRTITLEMLENEVRKWSHQQSKVVEELKSREQFRREYMGNVSHELKTPIFNIQGYILTLLDGAKDDPNVATKFLTRASKSVDRMTQLIKDMDVLSKVESGQYDIRKRPAKIATLIEDAMQNLESWMTKRKAKVKVEFKVDEGVEVMCDADRIAQVLDNLIVNAVKYGDEGKPVLVEVKDFENKVQVAVKDKGFGIPEKDLSRIFERFYRVDKARSREAGGSGLGLSIVKHIIDKHNETITVSSKEGVGTEFRFTLTKAPKAQKGS